MSPIRESGSDTDDTDADHDVGGMGCFSHGAHCLTHQHWVDQVISAGGFNVHCTQGAEAAHKINMYLASLRVRHLHANFTQGAMLKYLCLLQVFEHLTPFIDTREPRTRSEKPGVRIPIHITVPDIGPSLRFQRSILHREVRLSGVEFLDLLCVKLGLGKHRRSYVKLQSLGFHFGQKLIAQNGKTFWGTDSQYPSSTRARRDMLHLNGVEHGNALGCETICFVYITNAKSVGFRVDTLTLVVVRWLEPHPDAWQRDRQHRPICQGPLHVNNCLWRYAKSPVDRRSLVETTGEYSCSFNSYRHLFGETDLDQITCVQREKRAYFGLVTTESILDTMNMCNTFLPNSDIPVYDTWLQTVTMS